MKVKSESEVTQSCPTLSNPMDCSLQASPSMGFSRQEYWSGVSLPSPIIPLETMILKTMFLNVNCRLTIGLLIETNHKKRFKKKSSKQLHLSLKKTSQSYKNIRHYLHSTNFNHGVQLARFLCPWNSPGKNTRVGSHSLLQEIFPTQGLNPGLPHGRQIFYHLSHQMETSRTRCIRIHTRYIPAAAAAAAESLQSCPTLCDPRDSSPPGTPVPGIL